MGLLCFLEEGTMTTARYWKINESNLSVGEFVVMLLFAAMMCWLVPALEKRGLHSWAMVTKYAAVIGLIVCLILAFV